MPRPRDLHTLRIGDFIQKALTRLIMEELRDPRLSNRIKLGLVITEVKVSPDLASANVYFCCAPLSSSTDEQALRADDLTEILSRASGFLRSRLARILTIRTTPALRFVYDDTSERADRIASLLAAEPLSPPHND